MTEKPIDPDVSVLFARGGTEAGVAGVATMLAGLMLLMIEKGLIDRTELDSILNYFRDQDDVRRFLANLVSKLLDGRRPTAAGLTVIQGGKTDEAKE